MMTQLWPRLYGAPVDDSSFQDIDDTLLRDVSQVPWLGLYDLVGGLVGLGVYALDRLPNKTAAATLEQIVNRLYEICEKRSDGITYLTTPEQIVLPSTRAQFPYGYYDLGLAHGVAGIIAFLSEAASTGIATQKARELLDGVMAWMLTQQFSPEALGCFTYSVSAEADAPRNERQLARLAWCYGDLGIATSVLRAARFAASPRWEELGLEVGLKAARRQYEGSGIADAGICHGAAGAGHIFNRLFQATGKDEFREASLRHFEAALKFYRPGEGVGGFFMWDNTIGDFAPDEGLLNGSIGIGLALLSAVTPSEPFWDRLLLVSIPQATTVALQLNNQLEVKNA